MTKQHKSSLPDELDHKILQVSIENPEFTDEDLGKAVGLSRGAVVRRKKREGYQSILQSSIRVTSGNLQRIFGKAVHELETLLSDPDPRIRLASVSLALKMMPEIQMNIEKQNHEIVIEWPDGKSLESEILYATEFGTLDPVK